MRSRLAAVLLLVCSAMTRARGRVFGNIAGEK
jgi:hypothetical protein